MGSEELNLTGAGIETDPAQHSLAAELKAIRSRTAAFNESLNPSADVQPTGHSLKRIIQKGRNLTLSNPTLAIRSAKKLVEGVVIDYKHFADELSGDDSIVTEVQELGSKAQADERSKPFDPSATESIEKLVTDVAGDDIVTIAETLVKKFPDHEQKILDALIAGALASQTGGLANALRFRLTGFLDRSHPSPWMTVVRSSPRIQAIFGDALVREPSGDEEVDPREALAESHLYASTTEAKQQGLDSLAMRMDEVLAIASPGERLRKIHELVVPSVDLSTIPEDTKRHFETDLLIFDRPDGIALWERLKPQITELSKQMGKGTLSKVDLIDMTKKLMAEEARKDTAVTLDTSASGALRSHGTRTISGSPAERVFASHTQVTEPEMSVGIRSMAQDEWPPTSYFGLSVGLDEVYERLSEKYASLPADTIEAWAKREAFFQLIGSTIHPYLDGNSRALFGFLMTSAQERGLERLDPDKIEPLVRELVPLSSAFLNYSQQELSGLGWVHEDLHFRLLNPAVRADYMKRLKAGLEKAIDQGVDGTEKQAAIINDAAEVILNTAHPGQT